MNDSPLSPEAVAQMVADLTHTDGPDCEMSMLYRGVIADAMSALSAENATLRAERAMLKFDIDKMLTQIEGHNAAWDELRASEAAAVARADQARNAALVEAANEVEGIEGYDNIGGEHPLVSMILALRDKPAPGATPKIEVKFTWAKGDEEFWVHLKSPDGKSAGFNLGNPKGMIATALLRAIAGGGDE